MLETSLDSFPPDSINGRVEKRLTELADAQIAFAKAAQSSDESPKEGQ